MHKSTHKHLFFSSHNGRSGVIETTLNDKQCFGLTTNLVLRGTFFAFFVKDFSKPEETETETDQI